MPKKRLGDVTIPTGLASFFELPKLSQRIIEILCVCYSDVTRTEIAKCLSHLELRTEAGKPFLAKHVTPLIEDLTLGGWAVFSGRVCCAREKVGVITRLLLAQGRFFSLVAMVETIMPVSSDYYGFAFRDFEHGLRHLRFAVYGGDVEKTDVILNQCVTQYRFHFLERGPLDTLLNNPFDAEVMDGLKEPIVLAALREIINRSYIHIEPVQAVFDYLKSRTHSQDGLPDCWRGLWVEQLVLRGDFQALELIAEESPDAHTLWAQGCLSLLKGDAEGAVPHFLKSLKLSPKVRGRAVMFEPLRGLFYVLALVSSKDGTHQRKGHTYLNKVRPKDIKGYEIAYGSLQYIQLLLKNGQPPQSALIGEPVLGVGLNGLLSALFYHWADIELKSSTLADLGKQRTKANAVGYRWIGSEMDEVLERMGTLFPVSEAALAFRKEVNCQPLVNLIEYKSHWERTLDALLGMDEKEVSTDLSEVEQQSRLVWFVDLDNPRLKTLEVREQKRSKKGGWTKGRVIALKRLWEDPDAFDCASPQDRAAIGGVRRREEQRGWGGRYTDYSYLLTQPETFLALVGHPNLVWAEAPTRHVELSHAHPELSLTKNKEGFKLAIKPALPERGYALIKDGQSSVKLFTWSEKQRKIAELLEGGLELPKSAQKHALKVVDALAKTVSIQSSIGGGESSAETIEADERLCLRLSPLGDGLAVRLLSHPFPTGGPVFDAGLGANTLIAEVGGKLLRVERNLKAESRAVRAIKMACPTLNMETVGKNEWELTAPSLALQLLLELQQCGEELVRVEWPKGESIVLKKEVGTPNFNLKLKTGIDWFSATGTLQVDEGNLLDLKEILELMDAEPGPFIPLGEGIFFALTEDLRQKLNELSVFGQGRGRGIRFHRMVAPAIQAVVEGCEHVQSDKGWKAQIVAIKAAQDILPVVPSTLTAQLRGYQKEGFEWMSRLAAWGAGACLADDMGLGKTVQALAVVLQRAPEGPTLVVAPTSVCMNWLDEAERFAPTLQCHRFGPGDRGKLLAGLGPFDLVVCSYGLLQVEGARLSGVTWRTLILDEAQAIKNPSTKRYKAAKGLTADLRMALTGTPIENHLSDLWSIFSFINPGFLGSADRFKKRFAVPIERDRNPDAQDALKALIQPFILRRLKSDVLRELPAKTEVVLQVELSKDERVLYEALRTQALEDLEGTDVSGGAKHLQIFAHLNRLRRVCCNPQLILKKKAPPSTKLRVFAELLGDLLKNRHKVLVFSQFVDHLSLIRAHLNAEGISHQYLDGSTSAKKREEGVRAFQGGEGDVFLISLRAGGVGLNLTAADYVIHMDPWWNPAVEDQASDRVHRIGQKRPVTVYRLVTKGTIEEKIVELHGSKRALADSLLDGTEATTRLDAEALVELLREAGGEG